MFDAGTILGEAQAIKDWIVAIRRDLHRHPELMYEEVRTSEQICQALDSLDIPYRRGVAKTGVIAQIGTGEQPCVALRADMDALPITEDTGLDFSSTIPGKMHACGHDCHVAMLLGAARLLKAHEAELPGTVRLLFQPAEEGGAGGKRLCEAGVLTEAPPVQQIFGMHVWPYIPTGSIAGREGAFLAAAGFVEIVVTGKGGHAALPHLCIDPVVTASKIVCELQTIVSREIDPLEAGVVTIGAITGGEAFNVIPNSVHLRGTYRSLSLDGLAFLRTRIQDTAKGVAVVNRCTAEVTFPLEEYPPVLNDAGCWALAQQVGGELFGEANIHTSPPVMGGEDFAFYTQHIPGCFVGLGTVPPGQAPGAGLHHPRLVIDEDALPLGAALHVALATSAMERLSS